MTTRRTAASNPEESDVRLERVETTLDKVQQCLEVLTADRSRTSPATPAPHSRKYKVREPETFDGGPDSNLRRFISQASLVFKDLPDDFPDDEKKVNYAISHFRGAASSWIEPYLEKPNLPAWGADFELFTTELKRVFGHTSSTIKVIHDLSELKQAGSVPMYAVEFRQLASRLSWSDQPLIASFYNGLKNQIRGELIKTKDLFEMELEDFIALAVNIEIVQEQERSSKRYYRPARKSHAPNDPFEKPRETTDPPGPRPAPSNDSGSYRRLTEKERNHRRENNLCMYCGDANHIVRDCPVAPPRSPARPAQVSETTLLSGPQGNATTQLL
jgi:hypothetical protein